MFDLLLSKLLELFVEWNYIGLFLVSLGLPLPTEILILLLASTHKASILGISLVSALGGLVGSYLTYLLGYIFTEENLYKWVDSNGKYLKIDRQKVEKSKKKLLKRSLLYIFASRFIPWLKVVASIAAGFLKVNIFTYSIVVFLGGFLYTFIIAYIGSKIDSDLDTIKRYIQITDKWLIILTITYLLSTYIYKRRKKILKNLKKVLKFSI